MKILSGTWGGAGGVVVPLRDDGTLHPVLSSLLHRLSPDYLANVSIPMRAFEAAHPGEMQLRNAGTNRLLRSAKSRKNFLDGYPTADVLLQRGDADISRLGRDIGTFARNGTHPALNLKEGVSPNGYMQPSTLEPIDAARVIGSTGDPRLDAAIWSYTGLLDAGGSSLDLNGISALTLAVSIGDCAWRRHFPASRNEVAAGRRTEWV